MKAQPTRALFRCCLGLMVWAATCVPARSSAQAADAANDERGLHYDLPIDLAVTAGAGVTWLALELATPALVDDCRWCDRHADGTDTLNGLDRSVRNSLRWSNAHSADTWSTVFSFALAPLVGLGVAALVTNHDDRLDELPVDALLVVQSAFFAMVLNQVAKIAAARERPDVHARTVAERTARYATADNVSFFSGHTTLAFALATSSGTIASMRGYRLAPVMWATGLTLATVSGYLRIAADRHYATDVLTGAVVGAAVGFAVPYFFHRPQPEAVHVSASASSSGTTLLLSGQF